MDVRSALRRTYTNADGSRSGIDVLVGTSTAQQVLMLAGIGVILGLYTVGLTTLPAGYIPMLTVLVLAPFLAMVIGNVRKMLLAAAILDISIGFEINFNYQEQAASLGAVGGLGISITTLAVAGLYALWIADALLRTPIGVRPFIRPNLPLILYVGFAVISLVAARNTLLARFEIFMLIQTLLLFIYLINHVRTRDELMFVVLLLVGGLAFQSLLIITSLGLGEFGAAGIRTRVDFDGSGGGLPRIGGTVGSPNSAAGYLSLLIPAAAAFAISGAKRSYRLLGLGAFGLGTVALILTFSRGGWIAFAISMAIFGLLAWKYRWIPTLLPFGAVLGISAVLMTFRQLLLGRFLQDDAGAAQSRVPLMKLALKIIRDNPLFGVGANNYGVVLQDYVTPEFSRDWLYAVHNKYLLVWAETGTGAFLAFVAFLVTAIHLGIRTVRMHDRLLSPLALAFTTAIVGHMAHMMVDLFNGRPQVQLLWVIIAILTILNRLVLDQPDQELAAH